jgi:hypothetical protein
MNDDDLQHNLASGGGRFVQDLRILEGGRIEAKLWSLARQQPVWAPVAVPDWLSIDKACAAARSGRLIAQARHRQWMLSLERKEVGRPL